MVIILYALGAMLCASLCFLSGATWASLPKLRERRAAAAVRLASRPAESEGFKLAS